MAEIDKTSSHEKTRKTFLREKTEEDSLIHLKAIDLNDKASQKETHDFKLETTHLSIE